MTIQNLSKRHSRTVIFVKLINYPL